MDSVSQIALGAALGELVLGRRIGRRAAVLGGVLGTLPDLDVLVPYADAIDSFTRHRSWSHSMFVLTAASLPLAALARRLAGHPSDAHAIGDPPGFARWWLGVWLVLVTHPLLDSFTLYGTQLWWPLPVRPVSIGSVFIIDPLYTLPLLVGVVLVWRRRDASGWRANRIGLLLSSGYLGVTLLVQVHVAGIARASLAERGEGHLRPLVTPLPLSLLWRVVAVDGDTDAYLEGWYSPLDATRAIGFTTHDLGTSVLGAAVEFPSIERLVWFTDGFARARARGAELVVTDLRIGAEDNYVFSFAVGERDGPSGWRTIVARELTPEIDLRSLRQLLRRVVDERVVVAPEGGQR